MRHIAQSTKCRKEGSTTTSAGKSEGTIYITGLWSPSELALLEWAGPLPKHLPYLQAYVPKIVKSDPKPQVMEPTKIKYDITGWCSAVWASWTQLTLQLHNCSVPSRGRGQRQIGGAGLLLSEAVTVRWSCTWNPCWDTGATRVWHSGSTQS